MVNSGNISENTVVALPLRADGAPLRAGISAGVAITNRLPSKSAGVSPTDISAILQAGASVMNPSSTLRAGVSSTMTSATFHPVVSATITSATLRAGVPAAIMPSSMHSKVTNTKIPLEFAHMVFNSEQGCEEEDEGILTTDDGTNIHSTQVAIVTDGADNSQSEVHTVGMPHVLVLILQFNFLYIITVPYLYMKDLT